MRNTHATQRSTWAAYVRAIREASSMSRIRFAERLSVDPTTVWRWETGRQKPESPDVPKKLADLFKLDLDEVLTAAGLKPNLAALPREPREPAPELDPDVKLILRRLADPQVGDAEKATIRATLRYLADLADRQPAPTKRPARKRAS